MCLLSPKNCGPSWPTRTEPLYLKRQYMQNCKNFMYSLRRHRMLAQGSFYFQSMRVFHRRITNGRNTDRRVANGRNTTEEESLTKKYRQKSRQRKKYNKRVANEKIRTEESQTEEIQQKSRKWKKYNKRVANEK